MYNLGYNCENFHQEEDIGVGTDLKGISTISGLCASVGKDLETKDGLIDSSKPYHKTINHCEPLQAPPYKFPISDKALEQFDKALETMDAVEEPVLDEFDTYLQNDDNDNNHKIIKEIPKKRKRKGKEEDKNDKMYELLIFFSIGIIFLLLCEMIVRIANSN